MNIMSYRGPAAAGGVSTALARIIQNSLDENQYWWHMDCSTLQRRNPQEATKEAMTCFSPDIVSGHYRYCNGFLWPLLHDLPQYAKFDLSAHFEYLTFNKEVADSILRNPHESIEEYFVNDYQLALVPGLLCKSFASKVIVFWHIPWPRSVSPQFVPFLSEIARGLLGARRIGFHTDEYCENFMNFVAEHLLSYTVDFATRSICFRHSVSRPTELCALPLGLDVGFWKQAAASASIRHEKLDLSGKISGRFILSVDRADYTKGVLERLNAIDEYFARHLHRRGELTFVQVCQPTRMGLAIFDHYWQLCRQRCDEINARWGTGDWQPIHWLDKPVPLSVLSWLYRNTDAMLINPVRDGLNLTAKEFIVCSHEGALILSRGAGVWQEVGEYALTLDNLSPQAIGAQVERALNLPALERQLYIYRMKKIVETNDLETWWHKLSAGKRSPRDSLNLATSLAKCWVDKQLELSK